MRRATLPGRHRIPRLRRPRVTGSIGARACLLPAIAAGTLLAAAFAPPAASASVGRYVSLGDSFTSAPLVPRQTGTPFGCLRSDHDYPSLVAAAVGASSFRDASCQGADTTDMTGPQAVPLGTNPPQFSALTAGTSLVTVQISGNDIDFAGIVTTCTELSFTNPFGAPCKARFTSGGTDQLSAAITRTAPKVAAVLRGIRHLSPRARVLLVGYPVILPASGQGCWPVVPIARGDVPYLRGIEIELNRMLAGEAAAAGTTFVDTYTASIGHDACEPPGVKWVEGLVPTSPAAPFHPNALGERGMALRVEAVIG